MLFLNHLDKGSQFVVDSRLNPGIHVLRQIFDRLYQLARQHMRHAEAQQDQRRQYPHNGRDDTAEHTDNAARVLRHAQHVPVVEPDRIIKGIVRQCLRITHGLSLSLFKGVPDLRPVHMIFEGVTVHLIVIENLARRIHQRQPDLSLKQRPAHLFKLCVLSRLAHQRGIVLEIRRDLILEQIIVNHRNQRCRHTDGKQCDQNKGSVYSLLHGYTPLYSQGLTARSADTPHFSRS